MDEFIPFLIIAGAIYCTFVYLVWFDVALLFYLFVRKAVCLTRKLSISILGAVLAVCGGAAGFFGDLETLATIIDGKSESTLLLGSLFCVFPITVWIRSVHCLSKNKKDKLRWGEVVVITPAALCSLALLTLGVMGATGQSF